LTGTEKEVVYEETLANLRKISATTSWCTLGRVMKNWPLRDSYRMMNMRPIVRSNKICGPAVTARYHAVDPITPTPEEEALINNHKNMILEMMNALSEGKVLVWAARAQLIAKGEYTHQQPIDEETLKKYGLLEKYKLTRKAQV